MGTITTLPGWGGLLLGGALLGYGLRGGWHLMAHLHDAPEPLSAFIRPHDELPNGEAALLAFEDEVNEYLRALAEARRLAAEAEMPPPSPLPAGLGWTVTTASTPPGGATFTPRPPDPYPPSLLPGILP